MKLGDSEQLIRVYNYSAGGKASKNNEGGDYSLTVTNKRIISGRKDSYGWYDNEIRIQDVKSVSCGIEVKRPGFLLVLGIILVMLAGIAYAVLPLLQLPSSVAIGAAVGLGVLGVLLILLFIFQKHAAFYLILGVTDQYYTAMKIFASNGKLLLAENDNRNIDMVRVPVNDKIARQLVDEIGAIIVDCQSGIAKVIEQKPQDQQ